MSKDKSNKMDSMSMPRLIINVGLPLVISLLIQSSYNIIDGIYVSRISEIALTATSLVYPIQMLMVAMSVGTGVGLNSLISRYFGAKNYDAANQTATTGLILAAISSSFFVLFGLLGVKPFLKLYTQDQELLLLGTQYLRICTIFSLGIFVATSAERMLQATGNSVLSMAAQVTGAVVNIVLDPILIFGYFGLPAMGIVGAAVATVIGQFAAAIIALTLNVTINKDIRFLFRGFKMRKEIVWKIYKVGAPSMLVQAMGSLMIMGLNNVLIVYSSTAVAFFGVYYKLQNFVFMPASGLSQGLIPIVGYHFGAKNYGKIDSARKIAIKMVSGLMGVGMLLFLIFPEKLLSLYQASEEMLSLGVPALRIISFIFIPCGIVLVTGYVFTGMGNGMVNMIMSIIRQLLPIPLIAIASKFLGIGKIWYVFWVTNFLAMACAMLCYRKFKREKLES